MPGNLLEEQSDRSHVWCSLCQRPTCIYHHGRQPRYNLNNKCRPKWEWNILSFLSLARRVRAAFTFIFVQSIRQFMTWSRSCLHTEATVSNRSPPARDQAHPHTDQDARYLTSHCRRNTIVLFRIEMFIYLNIDLLPIILVYCWNNWSSTWCCNPSSPRVTSMVAFETVAFGSIPIPVYSNTLLGQSF